MDCCPDQTGVTLMVPSSNPKDLHSDHGHIGVPELNKKCVVNTVEANHPLTNSSVCNDLNIRWLQCHQCPCSQVVTSSCFYPHE